MSETDPGPLKTSKNSGEFIFRGFSRGKKFSLRSKEVNKLNKSINQ